MISKSSFGTCLHGYKFHKAPKQITTVFHPKPCRKFRQHKTEISKKKNSIKKQKNSR